MQQPMSWAQRRKAFVEKQRISNCYWKHLLPGTFGGSWAQHRSHEEQAAAHLWEYVCGLLRLPCAAPVKAATEEPSWVAKCI